MCVGVSVWLGWNGIRVAGCSLQHGYLIMDILMSETCWAHKKWNKIASDIKLVFYSSIITMMHGPINIRFTSVFVDALHRSHSLPYPVRIRLQERKRQRVISGFYREVDENCALMGYYAASSGKNNAHNAGYVKHTRSTYKCFSSTLTFIRPCMANIFSKYHKQEATFLRFIYFCKTLYMFQTGFPPIIRSSNLHIQCQTNTATCC